MKRLHRTGTIYTEVSIDVADVMSELSDADVRDECMERGLTHEVTPPEGLLGAVTRRHDAEHHGPQVMCRDSICEAATRDELPATTKRAA